MEETFEINEYHFVDKKSRLGMVIYSRTKEFAEKVISLHNICSCCHWVPKKIGFVKAIQTNRPPYDLELEQLEYAKEKLQRRQEKNAKKKGN